MKLIQRIKQRFKNMKTVSGLLTEAEKVANASGESTAGSEHLVIAALNLPDGTARQVFKQLNVDPDAYADAISKQQAIDLKQAGIDVSELNLQQQDIEVKKTHLPHSKPSAQQVLREMASNTSFSEAKPLLGADVLAAVANQKQGIAVSALTLLEIDPAAMRQAALQVTNVH